MLSTERLQRLAFRHVFPARELAGRALTSDLHLHTTFTDGRSTVEEMLQAAAECGLQAVAFTEHVRRGCDWYPRLEAELETARARFPDIEILAGIEAKAFDRAGGLDADPELAAHVDIVLGAFHSYPDGQGGTLREAAIRGEEAAWIEAEATLALLENPLVDVIAHPGAMTRRFFGSFPHDLVRQIVRKAARLGKAVELNGEYCGTDELAWLLRCSAQENAWVTLGSNAHHTSEVGRIVQMISEVSRVSSAH